MEVLVPARFEPPPPQLTLEQACEILRPLFFDEGRRIVNQNLKFDIKSLVRAYDGEFIPGPYGDTIVAQHTVDENAFVSLNLGALVERHFGHSYDKLGSKGVHNFSFNAAARYAEQDAKFTWLLWKRYERILRREGLFDLFEFKMQVMEMLMRKEWAGAYVDSKAMEITRQTYEKRKRDTVARLLSEHSVPPTFNPDSTLHKADLLFTRLKAPVLKRTGTGKASVDAETLEKVAQMPGEAGQAAQTLLDYAEVSKVIGTYFVGMGAKLDGAGFLHPDFTQHAADTGRLACRTRTSTTSHVSPTSATCSWHRRGTSWSVPTTTRSSCGSSVPSRGHHDAGGVPLRGGRPCHDRCARTQQAPRRGDQRRALELRQDAELPHRLRRHGLPPRSQDGHHRGRGRRRVQGVLLPLLAHQPVEGRGHRRGCRIAPVYRDGNLIVPPYVDHDDGPAPSTARPPPQGEQER